MTAKFIAFLISVTIVYRICPHRLRPLLLLAASYFFYLTWSAKAAVILLAVTTVAFFFAHAIEAAKSTKVRRLIMLVSLATLVVLLGIFKITPSVGTLLEGPAWIPLGISYYTFKLISYVLDVYWGKIFAEQAFIPFAAYVAFFPQIVGGPIQRSDSFLSRIRANQSATWVNVVWGLLRILLGFFKKFVVADVLAMFVNFIYAHLHESGTPLAIALYLYPLQIYADFSGLSDIAIGASWMLGIKSPENFNAPFSAPNPSEFWRRWHITLTSLLTDYVYTPMRMTVRRFGDAGLVVSLFVTMVLIGIWHGFRWTYAVFGLVHANFLAIDALTLRGRKRLYKMYPAVHRLTDWVGPLVTFHLIAFAFVLFRAESLGDALYMIRNIGGGIGTHSADFSKLMENQGRALVIGVTAYMVTEAADYLRRHGRDGEALIDMPTWRRWMVYSFTTVAVLSMVLFLFGVQVNPSTFVYAMF